LQGKFSNLDTYYMKKITEEWLISAESDLSLIGKLINEDDLTHLLAFHAQQAVEKSFKAIIEEYELGFIKTHSLETLFTIISNKIAIELNEDILLILDQLYIDARYPGEMGLLPDGKPTIDDAVGFYEFAKFIFNSISLFLETN
jgi:HEPN domain-containing protein